MSFIDLLPNLRCLYNGPPALPQHPPFMLNRTFSLISTTFDITKENYVNLYNIEKY